MTTVLSGATVVELAPVKVSQRDLAFDEVIVENRSATEIDCSGCVIVPGLVLAHTHLYSALAPGMPGPAVAPHSFRQILERVWWRLDQALDEATLRASAWAGVAAAAKFGVTTIFDHHESPNFIDGSLDVLAEAVEGVGLRGFLTYGATDRHGRAAGRAGLAESERFAKNNRKSQHLRGAIGLHAPFTCGDALLQAAAEIATENEAWLHFHAAEGTDDQAMAGERWNTNLVAGLDQRGLLGPRTLLAHAVDVSAADAELLRQRQVWVAHQARSNQNNGVGYAQALRKMERLAIGTDGIDQDVLTETVAAWMRRREFTGPSVWPSVEAWVAAGQQLAAEVFGLPLGRLDVGAPADLVVLDYDAPTPLTDDSLGAHLLFGIRSAHVRDVFVAGKPVVLNRRLVAVDETELMARAKEAAPVLWTKMESF